MKIYKRRRKIKSCLKKQEPKIEIIPKGEELSEEGVEKEAIETTMNEGKCSRQVIIRAFRMYNGNPIEDLLEVWQKISVNI